MNTVEKNTDSACPDGIPKISYGKPFLNRNRFPCVKARLNV
jgi:hypothetical protein